MADRYEREIDELLSRLEGRPRKEPLSRRIGRRVRPYSSGFQSGLRAFLRRPPSEQFMIAALVMVIAAVILGYFAPRIAGYVSALSILCFVVALGLSIAGRRSPGYQKKWRGKIVDYPAGPSIWNSLRKWFRRRR
ncbi:MAG: hypothetical protein IT307_01355 [Chloroflexi bacterium]|nr:hypothetical protein [Chloroflexota bacterium]